MEYVGWFLMLLGFIPAGIGFRFGAPTNACSSMIPRHVHTVNVTPCPYKLKLQDDATTYTPGGNLKANAMPSGAPKSACVSMTPDHVDTSAEMSTPPYSLQLERGVTTYTPGQTLKVCVTGKTFKGILLQMRVAEGTFPVGRFMPDLPSNTKLTTCSANGDSVTHSNANDKADPSCFVWKAPAKDHGDLMFVATIAEQRDVYWVKITSDIIKSSFNTEDNAGRNSDKSSAIALGIMFATFALCALLAAAAHLLE